MSRALGPRPALAPGGTGACWAVLITCWGLAALNGIVWAAARAAATLSGGAAQPFGIKFGSDVLHERTTRAWPHTPTPLVAAIAVLLLGLAAGLVIMAVRPLARHWPAPGDPVAALARNPAAASLSRRAAAAAAVHLRPSLAGAGPRRPGPDQAGAGARAAGPARPHRPGRVRGLGRHHRRVHGTAPEKPAPSRSRSYCPRPARSSPPPTRPTCGPPPPPCAPPAAAGYGCSTRSTSPTSRKPGGETPCTAWPRSKTRTAWPRISCSPSPTSTAATCGAPAAQDLLAALLLAAATSGHTLADVARWLSEPAVPTPAELLAAAGQRPAGHGRPDRRTRRPRPRRFRSRPGHQDQRPCYPPAPSADQAAGQARTAAPTPDGPARAAR